MKFTYISLIAAFFIFVILLIFNKKYDKILERAINSAIDSITLTSGLILLFYLYGKIFSNAYFISIDESWLFWGIFLGGIALIFYVIDKYFEITKRGPQEIFPLIIKKRKKSHS